LADAGLWRFIFFINVPIGIAALVMLWLKVEEKKDTGKKMKGFPKKDHVFIMMKLN
jgi:hypothetical protein